MDAFDERFDTVIVRSGGGSMCAALIVKDAGNMPFYAVAIYPHDVGNACGLDTDRDGRLLRDDGSVIEGPYATGNSTAFVMGDAYPGAGASIGVSFDNGYRAARHAMLSTS